MQTSITDKFRIRYPATVDFDDDFWTFHVLSPGRDDVAARATCIRRGQTLDLRDIVVTAPAVTVPPRPLRGLRIPLLRGSLTIAFAPLSISWHVRSTADAVDFRRRGIGSALLHLILDLARAHDCADVVGQVFPADFGRDPELLNWYQRQGFTVERLPADAGPIANIRFALSDGA